MVNDRRPAEFAVIFCKPVSGCGKMPLNGRTPEAMAENLTDEPRSAWGRYVAEVLRNHGLSIRGQRPRTGIPHSTVNGWMHDIPPQEPNVVAFARGMGEDVNRALILAGYEPQGTPTAPVLDALELRIQELAERYDAPGLMLRLHKGDEALTPAAVDRWAARMEEFLQDLQAEQSKDAAEPPKD